MNRCFFILCFLISFFTKGQNDNLVKNGSFEDTIQCPLAFNDIKYWTSPTTGGSPDIGTNCFVSTAFQVVKQFPRTGICMAGIINYETSPINGFREYIQGELKQTLNMTKQYCLTYYINFYEYALVYCNNVNAAFSNIQLSINTNQNILLPTVVSNPSSNNLTDTVNWIKVSGVFTALGSENYLIIGNFFDNASSTAGAFPNSNGNSPYPFYWIDDVSIYEMTVKAGSDTILCLGDSLTIGEQNLDTSFTSYYWYSGGVLIDSVKSLLMVQPNVTTTYVIEKRLCQSVYDTVTVTVKPKFAADIISSPVYVCTGDSIKLTVSNGIGSTQWNWQPNAAINNAAIQQPTVAPAQTATYSVSTNFLNPSGFCNSSFTDSVQVVVLASDTCSTEINLVIPNVFTPNYDDLNDVFGINVFSGDIETFRCIVFDRWGIKVYESSKYKQKWDGHTTSGEICEAGTYYYIIKAENSISKKEYKGFVQLQR